MPIVLARFSYFTDLQGSQTILPAFLQAVLFSYFTDLQGSQTRALFGHHL